MHRMSIKRWVRAHAGFSKVAFCAAVGATAVGVAACGGGSGTSGAGTGNATTVSSSGPVQKGGTLTIASPLEPVSLDPNVGETDAGSQHIQTLVFERLIEINPDTNKLEPGLASSWQLDRKANTATFHLRQAQFSSGLPVTSADVKFSFERAMNPEIDPAFAETYIGLIESVTTPDPHTVVLHFEGPRPAVFPYLTMATLSVVSKKAFEELGAQKFAALPTGGGSGPFEVVKWDKGQFVELAANPHYWQKGKPYLEGVKTVNVPDDNTRILDIKSGQVDVADELPYSQLAAIEATSGVKLQITPLYAQDTIFFKAEGDLKSKDVRQALNYATPKEVIKEVVFHNQGAIGNSIIPPMKYWDSEVPPYPLDVKKAKELLAKAGYPNGFNIELLSQGGDETSRQIGSILQDAWGKIGVDVSLQTLDAGSLLTRWTTPGAHWEAILFPPSAVSSDIPTEDEFAINFPSAFFEEIFGLHDPKLHELIGEIEGTWDEAKRKELFGEYQQEQMDNPIGIPIVVASARTALRENVEDFKYVSLNRWNLTDTWLGP
jgi:peptide/nickel transport system substrate-binding protein